MNFIVVTFSFLTFAIIVLGIIINVCENILPPFIIKTFKYGKFAYKGEVSTITSKLVLEVPKSWFKHFYLLAVLVYAYIFYLTTCSYIFQYDVPARLISFIDVICGENRKSDTSATKTYIAVVLVTLQVYRRFYDTHFVSVFGKNSRLNFSQYLIGLYHYPACALAILCEAPRFGTQSTNSNTFDLTSISYVDIVAILLFGWAWWHQHVTSKILGDLRRNKKGVVVSDEHKLPYGDWFNYLSCPHQTAEILMYAALTVLLWQNCTWSFVFGWVVSNQVETILLSHWWYQENFDKFPKNRKALVPFVY